MKWRKYFKGQIQVSKPEFDAWFWTYVGYVKKVISYKVR